MEIITSTCRVSVHVCVALHFATRMHGSQLLVTHPRTPAKFAGNSRVTNVNGALSTSVHGHRGGDHEHLCPKPSKLRANLRSDQVRQIHDEKDESADEKDEVVQQPAVGGIVIEVVYIASYEQTNNKRFAFIVFGCVSVIL